MIDKSIRQHYQTGEEVKKLKLIEMGKELMSPIKEQIKSQALPSEGRKIPNIIRTPLQRTALSKLGLGALNPILGLLSLFGIDPLGWAGRKLTEGGVGQAFTAGMTGSPAEGRELRQLEARRANMLRRKEEGKSYSQKNLDEVTNRINEIKGDPYEFEDRRTAPQRKQIIDQLYEFEDKKTQQFRDPIITPTVSVRQDPDTGDASIAERIAAENRAATQAAAVKAEIDRQQRERDAAAAAKARVTVSVPVPRHISHGGGNGGGGQAAADRAGGASYSSPFKVGGPVRIPVTNVDRPLTGRRRDI